MAFIVWNDRLSVNIGVLDGDHRRLVGILNELYDSIRDGCGQQIIGSVLDQLMEYMRDHFAREEQLLANTGYPEIDEHRKLHAEATAWIEELREQYREGKAVAPSLDAVVYLKDWLFDHILEADHRYISHLNAAGIR